MIPFGVFSSAKRRIAFVNSAHTVRGTTVSPTVTVDKPGGVEVNDLLIAVASAGSSSTFNTVPGWTEFQDLNGRSLQYRVLDGSEGASFTFTRSASTFVEYGASILAFRGATFGTASIPSALSANPVAASINVPANNSMLLVYVDEQGAVTDNMAPTGFTSLLEQETTLPTFGWFYKYVDAGASGNVTVPTSGSGTVARAFQISLSPTLPA